ncbi:MAG TPA: hypothetical protein GXX53_10505 [Tissierellia bacterium]|nr:hypothetical protein [Tissierellia bacterium]
MNEERILQLISLAREKNKLLNDFISITKRQMEEIEGERYLDLDRSLTEKDKIIKKIDEIDKLFLENFYKFKQENSIEDINELSIEEYPKLKELKEEVKSIMSNLLAISLLDEKNTESVRSKLKEAREDLKRVRLGRKAMKVYNYKESQGILIDKKK